MTEPTFIKYTPFDGAPETFGLSERYFCERLDKETFNAEKRNRLEPIGDVVMDFVAATNRNDIVSKLHIGLSEGIIKASGRFRARPLSEKASTVELDYPALIPVDVFRPEIAFGDNGDVDFAYYPDIDSPSESWISYHWSHSHIEYIAEGYTVDSDGEEWLSFHRWVCSWSAILVCRKQIGTLLGREIPRLKPFTRPKHRPSKSDPEIVQQIEKMRQTGKQLTDICRDIKHELGFEDVGNRFAQSLVKGIWKPGPRVKTQKN